MPGLQEGQGLQIGLLVAPGERHGAEIITGRALSAHSGHLEWQQAPANPGTWICGPRTQIMRALHDAHIYDWNNDLCVSFLCLFLRVKRGVVKINCAKQHRGSDKGENEQLVVRASTSIILWMRYVRASTSIILWMRYVRESINLWMRYVRASIILWMRYVRSSTPIILWMRYVRASTSIILWMRCVRAFTSIILWLCSCFHIYHFWMRCVRASTSAILWMRCVRASTSIILWMRYVRASIILWMRYVRAFTSIILWMRYVRASTSIINSPAGCMTGTRINQSTARDTN